MENMVKTAVLNHQTHTTMSRNFGGQKRTIFMPCGKTIAGHPREANNKVMLHRRHCELCSQAEYKPSPFESYGNDLQNIKMSRHGNISKATNKTIHAISHGNHRMINVDGVVTAEQSFKTLKEAIDKQEIKQA